MNVNKLNETSRELLIPNYDPHRRQRQHQHRRDHNFKSNRCHDDDDESNTNHNNDIDNDDENDVVNYTDVFYIMTIGVVDEYRNLGLASYLLQRALDDQIVMMCW